jgi:HSP20 family protein
MALPTIVRRTTTNGDPMTDMQAEFDTLLNRFFGGVPQTTSGRRSAPYAVDVLEDENRLYFEIELPGFKKDELDITVDNNVLTITAERRAERSDGEENRRDMLLNERRHTWFSRSFNLPPTVSSENVDARLEDGVLHLTLDKREESKPRKISVN